MNFRFLLCITLSLSFPVLALTEMHSTVSINRVVQHRMHSISHRHEKVENMYKIYVSGLEENCKSVYLYADKDPYIFATAMSALSSQKTQTISLYYHVDDSVRGLGGIVALVN